MAKLKQVAVKHWEKTCASFSNAEFKARMCFIQKPIQKSGNWEIYHKNRVEINFEFIYGYLLAKQTAKVV